MILEKPMDPQLEHDYQHLPNHLGSFQASRNPRSLPRCRKAMVPLLRNTRENSWRGPARTRREDSAGREGWLEEGSSADGIVG